MVFLEIFLAQNILRTIPFKVKALDLGYITSFKSSIFPPNSTYTCATRGSKLGPLVDATQAYGI